MMRGVEKFCPIYTLCIGNAFGEAALLLAAGSKVGGGSGALVREGEGGTCCCCVCEGREGGWHAVVCMYVFI